MVVKGLVFKVWSVDQPHQHHLGSVWNAEWGVVGPTRMCWIGILTRSPGDFYTFIQTTHCNLISPFFFSFSYGKSGLTKATNVFLSNVQHLKPVCAAQDFQMKSLMLSFVFVYVSSEWACSLSAGASNTFFHSGVTCRYGPALSLLFWGTFLLKCSSALHANDHFWFPSYLSVLSPSP